MKRSLTRKNGYYRSGASASLAFATPTKIAFINFNLSSKNFMTFLLKLIRNNFTKPMIKTGSCRLVDTNKRRRRSSRRARHKMFNKTTLLIAA